MKKLLLIFIVSMTVSSLYAQFLELTVDSVSLHMGETTTINPLLNDNDPLGGTLSITNVTVPNSCDIELISFNDTSVTFKTPEYYLLENSGLSYLNYVVTSTSEAPDWSSKIQVYTLKPNIDTLEINQIKTPVYPMNVQFYDSYFDLDGPNYMYPANSKTSPLFSTALWMAGKSPDDNLHVAAETDRQNGADFWPGPLSADGNATTDSLNASKWFRTWKVSIEEINNHIRNYKDPDYEMPEAIATWPAHGNPDLNQADYIAPFVDVDQDLEYHSELGDYPFIKGDISVFFVYNDQLEHTESQGLPLGLEVHCYAWAYKSTGPESPYDGTVFYSYKIFNKSSTDYYDTFFGVYNDFDLGNFSDDMMGCQVENGNVFVYNADDFDEDFIYNGDTTYGYQDQIPSQSCCVLSGPFMDADNLDNPLGGCDESINGSGFGDGEVDNERYGMSRYTYFTNSWGNYNNDPSNAEEYYNYMNGIWLDGSPMVYGGHGHYEDGGDINIPAKFMYPGKSDECNWGTAGIDPGFEWTELTAGNGPNEKRGLAVMGPFTFEAGSVEYLDIAFVTAPGDQDKSSKELLQDYIAQIKEDYLEDPMNFGYHYTGLEEVEKTDNLLEVYPNPVDGDQIWFELDEQLEADYLIYNAAGQVVLKGQLAAQKQHQINVGQLDSGLYLLEINTKNQKYRSKIIK